MSSVSEKGEGGVFRISGRKNIHNHVGCPFMKDKSMGRYGLHTNNHQEQAACSTSQEGTDEVDNIVSKFARASSPITTRKSENLRRNSFHSPNNFQPSHTDDSDEDSNLLSKSSPAILSCYSCCSEESARAYSKNSMNESANRSLSSNKRSTDCEHDTSLQSNRNIRRNEDKHFYGQQSTAKCNSMLILGSSIILIVIGIIVANYSNLFTYLTKNKEVNIIYDKLNFYNDMDGVGSKYKINDNSILQVRAGIATIFERQDTGSFIFAYNSEKRDFNSISFNNFVNEIATAAARYLRNHSTIAQHVVVDSSNLQVHSDKELMNEYVTDVDKTGVMLVKDLDRVPSAVAMAFHYYCDEYNPLVKKSAIFFTLNMASCSNTSSDNYSHDKIEKCLAEKWKKMPRDNIRPLLNRVVNVVIDMTSEF